MDNLFKVVEGDPALNFAEGLLKKSLSPNVYSNDKVVERSLHWPKINLTDHLIRGGYLLGGEIA